METLEPLLAEHPFLSGLTPGNIQLITGCAKNARFEAGQMIFREGEDADQFYLIRQGKVSLEVLRRAARRQFKQSAQATRSAGRG